jgi:hypothetical protein
MILRNRALTLFLTLFLSALALPLSSCDVYGKVGGADRTTTVGNGDDPGAGTPGTGEPGSGEPKTSIAGIIGPWRGAWYSHYGAIRMDGYRVGRWDELQEAMGTKLALFPDFDPDNPRLHDGYAVKDDDYFLFYDDTVYGEDDNGEGGNGGWEGLVTRYIGIVRTINIFNDNPNTGSVIIEYLEGCYPQWSQDVLIMPLPFFGMYYRVANPNRIQMANAVDLAALAAGKRYYTETATLEEAIEKNSAGNDSEFIAWGVVWPQEREQ